MSNFGNTVITTQAAPGTNLCGCLKEAFQVINGGNTIVKFKFNGVEIVVDKYSTLDSVDYQYKQKLHGRMK